MSFQPPTNSTPEAVLPDKEESTDELPSPIQPQVDEEEEEQTAEESEEEEAGFKVVNSKDLDKIDLTNFKFFVLPDNDDELPGDELLPENWSANLSDSQLIILPKGDVKDLASAITKAVAAKEEQLKEEAAADCSFVPDEEDLDVSDDDEDEVEAVDTLVVNGNEILFFCQI